MRRPWPALIIVLACGSMVGCTSMRTVLDAQPGTSAPPALGVNDSLTITTRDGAQMRLVVTLVTPSFIEGSGGDAKQLRRVDLAEITRIERREFDGVKTAFLVIAIAAGVYAIVSAIAQATVLSGG